MSDWEHLAREANRAAVAAMVRTEAAEAEAARLHEQRNDMTWVAGELSADLVELRGRIKGLDSSLMAYAETGSTMDLMDAIQDLIALATKTSE